MNNFQSDQKMTTLFSISLINFLQAKIEKQMNLNMNIQTILSKYPFNISDRANQIFNQPLDYSNCQNDFFQDVFNYVRAFSLNYLIFKEIYSIHFLFILSG